MRDEFIHQGSLVKVLVVSSCDNLGTRLQNILLEGDNF
jgi:hypothetical protein